MDCRRLRRNVNRRRKRVCGSPDESFCCCSGIAVGDTWLNLSKNVRFLFIDARFACGVKIRDVVGNVICFSGIGFDFVRLGSIGNGWIVVGVNDDDRVDADDKAK